MNFAIDGLGRARASKDIGSCIGWVMQNPQHIMVLDLSPHNFSLMRPAPHPSWKEEVFLAKVANRRKSRSSVPKAVKDLPNGGLHLRIGVKNNGVAFGVTQPNGQGKFEGSTPGFVEDTPLQTGTQHKKLSLRHGPFQTEQQTIIESRGIIESLFIQNQGVGERTDFQQMMPITGVTCESGDL